MRCPLRGQAKRLLRATRGAESLHNNAASINDTSNRRLQHLPNRVSVRTREGHLCLLPVAAGHEEPTYATVAKQLRQLACERLVGMHVFGVMKDDMYLVLGL